MRKPQLLAQAFELLRGYYNFIRPNASLRFGRVTRTPAIQGGLFKRALSFREIFSWVPGPIEGRRRSRCCRGGRSHQGRPTTLGATCTGTRASSSWTHQKGELGGG